MRKIIKIIGWIGVILFIGGLGVGSFINIPWIGYIIGVGFVMLIPDTEEKPMT